MNLRNVNGTVVLLFSLAGGSAGAGGARVPALVPKPVSLVEKEGFFSLSAETKIVADEAFSNEADLLASYLGTGTGFGH